MPQIEIIPALSHEVLLSCSAWMAESDPWKRLGMEAPALIASMIHPLSENYVAVRDADVVGLLTVLMEGMLPGYIKLLAVHPSHRSHGIGRQLLDYAERRIFNEATNVFVCVSSFNGQAQQFYKRCGYHVVGELTDYLVEGYSEILMRKSTGPALRVRT